MWCSCPPNLAQELVSRILLKSLWVLTIFASVIYDGFRTASFGLSEHDHIYLFLLQHLHFLYFDAYRLYICNLIVYHVWQRPIAGDGNEEGHTDVVVPTISGNIYENSQYSSSLFFSLQLSQYFSKLIIMLHVWSLVIIHCMFMRLSRRYFFTFHAAWTFWCISVNQ